jgi:adenylate cyclase
MPYEIERKFLITGPFQQLAFSKKRIKQGYLAFSDRSTVRVRTKGNKGFITIKGKPTPGSFARYEWEKEIELKDAEDLLTLCIGSLIDKFRYEVKVGKHVFEVDEFLGANFGLFVAEVELSDENEDFERPDWIGQEVTNDKRYYNSHLSKHPYTEWTNCKNI